jgi:hypothetical protein
MQGNSRLPLSAAADLLCNAPLTMMAPHFRLVNKAVSCLGQNALVIQRGFG